MRTESALRTTPDQPTALENRSHQTDEPEPLQPLRPWVMTCRCGATLKIAFAWTAFRCATCGRVTAGL